MKPHKHAELIKAWADGAEIEALFFNDARDYWTTTTNPNWSNVNLRFRIKPVPKPDIVVFRDLRIDGALNVRIANVDHLNEWRLTFDGETRKLKLAEALT